MQCIRMGSAGCDIDTPASATNVSISSFQLLLSQNPLHGVNVIIHMFVLDF